ncbi:hypothetical protein COXBURSA331_A2034 [Coxiella burnetii RSA 331]|nr:hypothetical protein COXBURSA331_A2034 [Coxiella burnetii RSA 331]EDR36703.1 hypothetical protein COXBURSA334_2089 [Coxiella burnetii Q321]
MTSLFSRISLRCIRATLLNLEVRKIRVTVKRLGLLAISYAEPERP